MVATNGYPGIRDHDDTLKAEYAEFFRTKDLEWLLGYCEGFESLVAGGAEQWVDLGWGEYLDDADHRVIELWRWHLAEEYEHRTVVHRLFHRLCAGTSAQVHAKRVELFNFTLDHLMTKTDALRQYLLDVDRATMTDDERRASERSDQAIEERFQFFFGGVEDVLSPDWDPALLAPPREIESVLSWYP
jgi:uncharacterized protein